MTDRQKDRIRQMRVDGCGYIKIVQELGIIEEKFLLIRRLWCFPACFLVGI